MEVIQEIYENPEVMRWSGAVILSLLGFGFMRVRRHPVKDCAAFAAGILGMCVFLGVARALLF